MKLRLFFSSPFVALKSPNRRLELWRLENTNLFFSPTFSQCCKVLEPTLFVTCAEGQLTSKRSGVRSKTAQPRVTCILSALKFHLCPSAAGCGCDHRSTWLSVLQPCRHPQQSARQTHDAPHDRRTKRRVGRQDGGDGGDPAAGSVRAGAGAGGTRRGVES